MRGARPVGVLIVALVGPWSIGRPIARGVAGTQRQLAPPQGRAAAPPRAVPERPRVALTTWVPLAHARYFGRADLWLQNRASDLQPLTLDWSVNGRGVVEGPAVELAPHELRFLDAADLLPSGVGLADVTGLAIRYRGRLATEVSAFLTLRPRPGADPVQALEVPFSVPDDFRGRHMEAVWAVPAGDEPVVVAAVNTSDGPVTVTASRDGHSTAVRLEGHAGGLISVPPATAGETAGLLRLDTATSAAGGVNPIRAAGFTIGADHVPHLLRFHDSGDAEVGSLFATAVPAHRASATLAIANVSDAPVRATASFLDAAGVTVGALPTLTLGPRTARLVDLAGLGGDPRADGTLSARIDGTGPKGSLLANLQVVDGPSGLVVEVPFSDVLRRDNSVGFYPWRIDGSYETRLAITNFGEAASFTLYISVGDRSFAYGVQPIPAGATVALDLRRLRDSGVTDRSPTRGILPPDAEFGQLHWSFVGRGVGAGLLGRADIVDAAGRLVRSVSDQ